MTLQQETEHEDFRVRSREERRGSQQYDEMERDRREVSKRREQHSGKGGNKVWNVIGFSLCNLGPKIFAWNNLNMLLSCKSCAYVW